MKATSLIFICLLFSSPFCFSQNTFSNIKYQLEAGTYFSTNNKTPFWLRSNQYGIVPLQSPIITLRGYAHKEYDSTLNSNQKIRKFGIGYGLSVVTNIGKRSRFFLPEAYFKTRYGSFEFYSGRRREVFGLVDTSLTSGSYIWSGNALPMPKIQISIPNYTQIGKSSVFIKAGFNHGWFGNQGFVKNHYLHQKWLYGRIGKEGAKLKFYSGFNHQVQWGGTTKNPNPFYSKNGNLAPYPLYSYQFVLIPFLQKLIKLNPDKLSSYDSGLAIGNHLGSVDIAFEIDNLKTKLLFYKQQPYDFARSLYNLNNIEDGLYGFNIKFKTKQIIKKILLEFLYTKSQGLYRFSKYQTSNYTESDNYFSHGQYIAWNYNDFIIGTPFILENENGIYNNRVKVFSTFIVGDLSKKTNYTLGGSLSNNLGTYGNSFNKNQFSGKLSISYSLRNKTYLVNQLAIDSGELYSKNLGISIIYRKLL